MTTTPPRVQLPLRLPPEDYEALKAYAYFTNTSMNDVIGNALHEFLTGPGRQDQMEAMAKTAQEHYRGALDKLRDL